MRFKYTESVSGFTTLVERREPIVEAKDVDESELSDSDMVCCGSKRLDLKVLRRGHWCESDEKIDLLLEVSRIE